MTMSSPADGGRTLSYAEAVFEAQLETPAANRARLRPLLALAIAMMTIPLVLWLAGGDFSDNSALTFTAGWLLVWAWVYYRIFRSRIVYANHIKQKDAWIQGVHPSIMEQITALPYPAAD
jgi:hypothetical protein